jgi:hypothetical protein
MGGYLDVKKSQREKKVRSLRRNIYSWYVPVVFLKHFGDEFVIVNEGLRWR